MARKVGSELARSSLHPWSDFHTIRANCGHNRQYLAGLTVDKLDLLGQSRQHFGGREIFARAIASPFDLELALGEPLRTDEDLPGNADQIGGGKFGARSLVGVIIENFDAFGLKLAVELFASRVRIFRALLEVQNYSRERRDRLRPFDTGLVVTSLDNGAKQPRNADPIGATVDGDLRTIGAGHQGLHGFRIFGAEIKDLADLDPPCVNPSFGWHLALEARAIMNVFRRSVD